MSNIISFFQNLIKGGVGIAAGGLENFSKINKRGGTIIRYSRVQRKKTAECSFYYFSGMGDMAFFYVFPIFWLNGIMMSLVFLLGFYLRYAAINFSRFSFQFETFGAWLH